MIINDINYLETTNEEVIGGYGGYSKDFSFNVEGDLDLDINVDLDFKKDVDIDVNAHTDISGNTAFFVGEATALGDNGTSELNVVLFTAGNVAEVTATGYAATH